jgi:subtilisin-like proprotein convertase family protein
MTSQEIDRKGKNMKKKFWKISSTFLCLFMMVVVSASSAGYVEEEISENQDLKEQPETNVMDEQEVNLDVKEECEDTIAQDSDEIPISGPAQTVISDPAPLAVDQPSISNAEPAETVDSNEPEQFYGSRAPPGNQNVQVLSYAPAMTTTAEYVEVDLRLRVAGTKGAVISMALMGFESSNGDCDEPDDVIEECTHGVCGGGHCAWIGGCSCPSTTSSVIGTVTVVREPGPPNTGGFPARIYLSEDYLHMLEIKVEPNGKGGANPVTLDMVLPDGEIKTLKHTFNHKHGWSLVIPDNELMDLLSIDGGDVLTTVSDSPEASFPSVLYPSGIFELEVGDIGVLTDVNVKVDISHTNVSDIEIALMHPSGAGIMLTSQNGGSGDNYQSTTFDDEASTPITSGSPPFNGYYQPEDPLSNFDGLNAKGTWKLYINDVNPSSDNGVLHSWSLELLT